MSKRKTNHLGVHFKIVTLDAEQNFEVMPKLPNIIRKLVFYQVTRRFPAVRVCNLYPQ